CHCCVVAGALARNTVVQLHWWYCSHYLVGLFVSLVVLAWWLGRVCLAGVA
ncbi:9515_t:CDS:1, partial [Gigaspora rosea]